MGTACAAIRSWQSSVYGLRVRSSGPIPGLRFQADGGEPQIRIRLGDTPPWLDAACDAARLWNVSDSRDRHGEPALRVWTLGDVRHWRWRYADGTEFIIHEAGTEIWARWPEPLTLEDTATYLLGPVLGFVLQLRGVTCLHASSVAVGEHAIALLGPAGAGKSTTAAALAGLGYAVLSEDVLALADRDGGFLVQPGYPCVRLWPESVHALYGASDALPRLTPTWDKRCLDLRGRGYRFHERPLPLGAVYVLGKRRADTGPSVEPVSTHDGMLTLLGNTYGGRLIDPVVRARQFRVLSRLAESVPLRRVTPHADPAGLPQLCDVILQDFHQQGPCL